MKLPRFLTWPSHPGSGLVPWPKIVWRVLWAAPAYTLLALASLCITAGWGRFPRELFHL